MQPSVAPSTQPQQYYAAPSPHTVPNVPIPANVTNPFGIYFFFLILGIILSLLGFEPFVACILSFIAIPFAVQMNTAYKENDFTRFKGKRKVVRGLLIALLCVTIVEIPFMIYFAMHPEFLASISN
jgi:hypothetical protein